MNLEDDFLNYWAVLRLKGPFSAAEFHETEFAPSRLVRTQTFFKDLNKIQKGQHVSKTNKILILAPFLDKDGILLFVLVDVPFTQRHPILLPGLLSVHNAGCLRMYEDLNHAGGQMLLCSLRSFGYFKEKLLQSGLSSNASSVVGWMPVPSINLWASFPVVVWLLSLTPQ